MIYPTFVLLFILVASHSCTSCNTDGQPKAENVIQIDSTSMTFEISVYDSASIFYRFLTTDSSFEILDHDGVCAIMYKGKKSYKGMRIDDLYRTVQAVYKIDSMLRSDYEFKLKK